MIPTQHFFEGKKITVMGLGLLGRGVGDVRFLAERGADVLVTDMKDEHVLKASVDTLHDIPGIEFRLGKHVESDFTECDMVIKAAGVPMNSPFILAAKQAGVPVYMSTALTALFAQEQNVRVIGVTGTRGKTTVAHIIYSVLHALQPNHTFLGGNIRGVSTLALLDEISPGDTLVLELDSWQLQGFGDLTISPNISVVTNLMPDHLNYYATMDDYFYDKAQIFLWQKDGDTLISGASVLDRVKSLFPPIEPIVPSIVQRSLHLPGEHNQENAALAAAALHALGLEQEVIEAGLKEVEAVEGRLQVLGVHRGVTVVNDNNATTPEATIAALAAVSDKGPITLIAGGSDKGIAFDMLAEKMKSDTTHVILLKGSGSDRIRALLSAAEVVDSMQEAVARAFAVTQKGGVILLSPACASFGLFTNEYDRNDQFVAAVNLYSK
jgi:UDP-N-acetylmuramoylalanine--D-glutamate ligase